MGRDWTTDELDAFDAADELHIAARRADHSSGPAVPVWVVRVGADLFVRTWHQRTTGWYGHAAESGQAHVRIPGVEADVLVEVVGSEHREAVDAAYHTKYGRYGASADRMSGDEAATTTLKLLRDSPHSSARRRTENAWP